MYTCFMGVKLMILFIFLSLAFSLFLPVHIETDWADRQKPRQMISLLFMLLSNDSQTF